MKIIDKFLSLVEKMTNGLVSILFVGMLFSLSVQVISRYVFNTGFAWTEESARYMQVWLVFAGASVVTKQDSHISVTALEEMVPKVVKPVKVLQRLVILAYSLVLTNFGIRSLRIAGMQTSPNMKLGMDIVYAIFPIVGALMVIYTIWTIVHSFIDKKEGGQSC